MTNLPMTTEIPRPLGLPSYWPPLRCLHAQYRQFRATDKPRNWMTLFYDERHELFSAGKVRFGIFETSLYQ
jgi:hypothetical protein